MNCIPFIMKKSLTFLCLLIVCCVHAQKLDFFQNKYIAFNIFINPTVAIHDQILDSTTIKSSHFKNVKIDIFDSLFFSNLTDKEKKNGKGYSENLVFNFLPSGRADNAEYKIISQKFDYLTELKWQYKSDNSVFLHSHSHINSPPFPTDNFSAELIRFNSIGYLLADGTWSQDSEFVYPKDTVSHQNFDTEEWLYDESFLLKRISSRFYFNDSLLFSTISTVDSYQKTGNIILSKTKNDKDTTTVTIGFIYNERHQRIYTFAIYGVDTLSSESCEYDQTGDLKHYRYRYRTSERKMTQADYYISRGTNRLPSKMLYRSPENQITFDFKWQ